MTETIFEQLIRESGWTPADGDLPGVWRDREPGHRCLWSCVWIHGELGRLDPGDYAPIDTGNYESADLIARGRDDRITLQNSRLHYPEYTWPFSGRYKYLVIPSFRPSWPRPAWSPEPPVPSISSYEY